MKNQANQVRSIAFISPDIPDLETIIAGLVPQTESLILQANGEEIAQITDALGKAKYSFVHIISHGTPGAIQLGNTNLNITSIERYSSALKQWSNLLDDHANILLYGCQVAAGDGGSEFVDRFHQLTKAGIAASKSLTGNAEMGGNWEINQIKPYPAHFYPSPHLPMLAVTATAQANYRGVLAISFAPKQDFSSSNLPAPGSNPYAVASNDFNSDGNPDIAVANSNSNDVAILLNNTPAGSSQFNFALQPSNFVGGTPTSITTADFNGDTKPDVAVATDKIALLINNTAAGANAATFAPKQDIDTVEAPYSIGSADFNGDGKIDLVTANYLDNTVSVLLNNTNPGDATATFAPAKNVITGVGVTSVATGDYNDDGKIDIAIANTDSDNFTVLLNNTPNGAVQPNFSGTVIYTSAANTTSVAAGDFNRDGKPDLAVTDLRPGNSSFPSPVPMPGVSLLVNNTLPASGQPNFGDAGFSPAGAVSQFLTNGDFNGDGFIEPVVDGGNGNISVFENTIPLQGANVFARNMDFTVGTGASSASVADFNRDGKPDLAVTNSASVSVLLNTTNAAPPVQPNQFFGTEIDDVLAATGGNDTINGLGGNDELDGLLGNDFIFGDRGNDKIYGGDGDDSLDGGAGNDVIYGQRDRDFINGGEGNDTLYGGKGNDTIAGDRIADLNGGFDLIYGNNNDDELFGGVGDDTINGGKENDLINGQFGNDVLSGDLGLDTLIGDLGQDIFVLRAGAGIDTIMDFKDGEDLLGLGGNLSFQQLSFTQQGPDAYIIAGGQTIAKLNLVNISQISATDFYPLA